jgi:dTMP kinase
MWIDFEGIDGSGKTTVSVRVAQRLRRCGLDVHHVRERGEFRSRLIQGIRTLTRDVESILLAPEAEYLLNAAREAQLLSEEIRPALARGAVVITDRGLHAHRAIAEHVRGLPGPVCGSVADFAAGGLWPDLVLLFDVDPDVARLRKRASKIRDRRLGMSGRKGLQGPKLARQTREALLRRAALDPGRWHVVGNTWRTVEEAERQSLSLIAPHVGIAPVAPAGPEPRPEFPRGGSLEEWTTAFFEFAGRIAGRDPGMAALLVAGLADPRAEEIREAALRSHPDVVAWSIGGMGTDEAWRIRRTAAPEAPYHVARSLTGLEDADSWRWRENLAEEVPDQVLHTLSGLQDPRAHALRYRLWEASPDEGLRSIGGLGDARSWSFRLRSLRRGRSGALAESLSGLTQEVAWDLRNRMSDDFPLSVLRSVKRVSDPRAWSLRHRMKSHAPRQVLETVTGLDGGEPRRLRLELERDFPEETAASLIGIDTPAAWEARERLLERAPAGVIAGLQGYGSRREAVSLAERALGFAGDSLRAVRKGVVFHLVKARQAATEVILS